MQAIIRRTNIRTLTALLALLCMVVMTSCWPAVTVLADESFTVEGTIHGSTTDTMLYLSTSGGLMTIKIDSSTDLSGCKMLLPGKKVRVTCARQNDEYLHASRIAAVVPANTSSTTAVEGAATVSGKVLADTTETLLKLDTSGGTMVLKIDGSTNWDNCRCLTIGKTVYVSCVRGSDAYMHALVISDKALTPSGQPSGSTSLTAQIPGNSVEGTVAGGTKPELLLLNTSGGQMQIKLDSNTDLSACRALVTGRRVGVGWVRGDDAYLHATKIVGVREAYSNASVDSSSAVTVQGSILKETTENILYLSTSGGNMALKLDASTAMNIRVLTEGASVKVSCARGSDAYMHALSINPVSAAPAPSAPSAPVTPTGDPVIIQGTVKNDTTENLLSVATSGGDMLIKIDANTNLSVCKALIAGDIVAVSCYRGSDAYMHASVIASTVQPGSATPDAAGAVTVTGTVSSGSNGGLLYLNTSGGMMQIKLDSGTRMGTCRILTLGRSVKVSVVRVNDGYMHALSIDAN